MAGVIMRLRQDGHDELQLHGPAGESSSGNSKQLPHNLHDSQGQHMLR